jgi:hypothetical protein
MKNPHAKGKIFIWYFKTFGSLFFFYSADNKMGYCNRNCNGEFEICLFEWRFSE